MMGPGEEAQGALFCEYSIEDHVPGKHLLRRLALSDEFELVSVAGKGGNLSGTELAPLIESSGAVHLDNMSA